MHQREQEIELLAGTAEAALEQRDDFLMKLRRRLQRGGREQSQSSLALEKEHILDPGDVLRDVILRLHPCAAQGADVEDGEAQIGIRLDELVHPRGHAAGNVGIRSFQDQADVRLFLHGRIRPLLR